MPEAREAPAAAARRRASPRRRPQATAAGALESLLDVPSIASKRWVFEQYDSTVQTSTVIGPGGDAGVLRVDGESFALAVTVDCNSRLVALDPYEGGKAAVAEAARNIACTGARPLGITDCLNFGNPEKPEVFFQFREACRGISDACLAFGTPVTGGNVSFYNESPTGAVDPTPTVGMVGLLRRAEARVPSHFQSPGDRIIILGATAGHLGGSAYWAELTGFVGGTPAPVDLEAEARLQRVLVAAAEAGLLRSAHDCSEGGLAVALAEAAIGGPYAEHGHGAIVDLRSYAPAVAADGLLYGEDQGRVVISCRAASIEPIRALLSEHRVRGYLAGEVGPAGGTLAITLPDEQLSWPVERLRSIYFDAIPRRMREVLSDRAGA